MHKYIALLFFFFLQSSCFAEHLRLLHFNDTYETMPQEQSGGYTLGGFAELKSLIAKKKTSPANTIVTFGGDMRPATVDGTPLESLDMLEVLNDMKLDAAVFGNHEFDEGTEKTIQFVEKANFPWICTNILDDKKQPFAGSPRYKIRKIGRFKIALIGVLTPETTTLSNPGKGVFFAPVVQSAQQVVKELKAEGVDVIIALTHLTIEEDKELLAKVPEIDIILGGHEHDPITTFVGGRMIHKSGNNAEYLGVIDIDMDKKGKQVCLKHQWEMVPVSGVRADPKLQKKLLSFKAQASKTYETVLAKTEVAIESSHSSVRSKQSPLGSLAADALREIMQADIAFINGGSIRGSKAYPAGANLTLKDVTQEFAFKNTAVVREVTGKQLREMLEAALALTPDPTASYPHISGFTVIYDSAKAKGHKIVHIRRNGNSIRDTEKLMLATTNYVAEGGDGLPPLKGCKGKDSEIFYAQAMEDYLKKTEIIGKEILTPRVSEVSAHGPVIVDSRRKDAKIAALTLRD